MSGRTGAAGAPVITIDGPSGTGKGTLRTRLASRLGFHMLDSGALYRALACRVLDTGTDPGDATAVARLAGALPIAFEPAADETGVAILLDGVDVTGRVREETVGSLASLVAQIPEVRAALLELQRDCRRPPGLVADGRDMGTVVFPEADFKLYLTASPETRAQRRHNQLKAKGIGGSLSQLFADIQARDQRDSARTAAPMRPAHDAIVMDTSELTIDEVTARVEALLAERGLVRSP